MPLNPTISDVFASIHRLFLVARHLGWLALAGRTLLPVHVAKSRHNTWSHGLVCLGPYARTCQVQLVQCVTVTEASPGAVGPAQAGVGDHTLSLFSSSSFLLTVLFLSRLQRRLQEQSDQLRQELEITHSPCSPLLLLLLMFLFLSLSQLQRRLQEQSDQLRQELENSHCSSSQKLQSRLTELETSCRELTERKYKNESSIRDLRMKLVAAEEGPASCWYQSLDSTRTRVRTKHGPELGLNMDQRLLYEPYLREGLVAVGDTIATSTERYRVEQILGSGSFGVVSLCRKSSTNQRVALKMIKSTSVYDDPAEEADMLRLLMDYGGASSHIVQWFGCFDFNGHFVHEFEHLDMSLFDFRNKYGPLDLKYLRPIVYQLGSALSFLKTLSIVHTDLKSDNIMMVNTATKPFQVKLIDLAWPDTCQRYNTFPGCRQATQSSRGLPESSL
ncbi:hypothetical protein WMY93_012528 [Mugilogobius chulae]|uniref:Protein kinase domain-containing protein n=1 Tax=Mugilogobius chulae TaxID=88201 RepID=A0AAW0P594_9GOBI